MKRIAVLVVGALIASMSLMASPASAADICTGGKYNVCVCTENCYCFETVNNVWREFFGSDLIVCH
jgi:Na+-translocating ferredoxin:NAD+ oxidoreductase RNF subunit RnfB